MIHIFFNHRPLFLHLEIVDTAEITLRNTFAESAGQRVVGEIEATQRYPLRQVHSSHALSLSRG